MECFALPSLLGCSWAGDEFYLKVFVGFILQNTVAMTIVYIIIVLYNKYRLMVIHSSFLLLLSLSHICCSRLCKVCSVLNDGVFINVITLSMFYFVGGCVCGYLLPLTDILFVSSSDTFFI